MHTKSNVIQLHITVAATDKLVVVILPANYIAAVTPVAVRSFAIIDALRLIRLQRCSTCVTPFTIFKKFVIQIVHNNIESLYDLRHIDKYK
jgi:hypothetical protein